MDLEHAKHILTVLSNGIHPITGEILPDSDSSNQLVVVRAINTVLRALEPTACSSKKNIARKQR